jgi:outer membrane immunogenic protein
MQRIFTGIVAVASLLTTSAFAADLAPRPYTKAPPPIVVVYDWNGFYIGGNAGYSWGRARTDGNETGTQSVSVFTAFNGVILPGFPVVTPLGTVPLTGRANVNGFVGGGQAGYNWQRGTWLFGLEGDIQGSDERGTADVCAVAGCAIGTGLFTANYKLDWFGTARGRVGFLPTDRVLLYATGGLAYGEVSATAPLIPSLSWGSTRAGWTLGVGGEAAIDQHWSVKLEYLYMDLGNVGSGTTTATNVVTQLGVPIRFNTVTTTTFTSAFSSRFTDNILRVGLNYRFGGPVVAKY